MTIAAPSKKYKSYRICSDGTLKLVVLLSASFKAILERVASTHPHPHPPHPAAKPMARKRPPVRVGVGHQRPVTESQELLLVRADLGRGKRGCVVCGVCFLLRAEGDSPPPIWLVLKENQKEDHTFCGSPQTRHLHRPFRNRGPKMNGTLFGYGVGASTWWITRGGYLMASPLKHALDSRGEGCSCTLLIVQATAAFTPPNPVRGDEGYT